MLMTILDLHVNICQLRQSALFLNAQFDLIWLCFTEQSDEISPSVNLLYKVGYNWLLMYNFLWTACFCRPGLTL